MQIIIIIYFAVGGSREKVAVDGHLKGSFDPELIATPVIGILIKTFQLTQTPAMTN